MTLEVDKRVVCHGCEVADGRPIFRVVENLSRWDDGQFHHIKWHGVLCEACIIKGKRP